MSRVSILDVEQDRRNDAAHLGLLPPLNRARGIKVRTGLETTQDICTEPHPPLSDSRRKDLIRRALEKENTRTFLRKSLQFPLFKFAPVQTTTQKIFNPAPKPRRVVVVVERKIVKTLLSGKSQVWLTIYKRDDERCSCRPPTLSDRSALCSKYPLFFFPWSDVPSFLDCVGEWRDGEWNLLNIFDPYA